MRLLLLISWFLLQNPAFAEVFKCPGKFGVAAYQPTPCNAATDPQPLDIKADPAKEAAAQLRLNEVRSEYETRKAARLKAEKLAAEQNYKAAALEAARQKAQAQQELAAAKRLQARAKKHHRDSKQQPKSSRRRAKQVILKMW